jgi:hypothetical protein
MPQTEFLLYIGGATHFAILIASAMVPRVLDWKHHLANLPRMLRQLFWVYGVFIVLTIIGFGTLTLAHAETLAAGDPLARWLCGFIAIFWTLRLLVQFFVFDLRPFLSTPLLRFGSHLLTLAFFLLVAIYSAVATNLL